MRLTSAAFLGFIAGAYACNYYTVSQFDKTEDEDIMNAYQLRQIAAFTAASGLKDAIFTSKHHNANDSEIKRPYWMGVHTSNKINQQTLFSLEGGPLRKTSAPFVTPHKYLICS